MKSLFIASMLAAFAVPAFADYGVGALRILCDYDTNRVEIEPYIAWNDNNSRFKEFQVEEAQSQCCSRSSASTSFYSYSFQNRYFIYDECRTRDRTLKVLVARERITVIESGRVPVDAQEIGNAWLIDSLLLLRSDGAGKWELCESPVPKEAKLLQCKAVETKG
jgi:hypothetical protein